MIITDAIIFKNELKYHKYYEQKCIDILEKIDEINELLQTTISSPLKTEEFWVYENYEFKKKVALKNKGFTNIDEIEEYKNSLRYNKERLLEKQKFYITKLNNIKDTLMVLDDDLKTLCERIYIKQESFIKVAEELNYSSGNLHKLINKRLSKIFECQLQIKKGADANLKKGVHSILKRK